MIELKEEEIEGKIVYSGDLLEVHRDKVLLPNGKKSYREWVNHPGAVCCIPILPNGDIVMVRQYRHSVSNEVLELPAGKIDKGERPEDCAHRELEEETGYKANSLQLLTKFYPAIGFANEEMWLFIAKDLNKTISKLDSDEFLEVLYFNLDDLVKMVWDNKITDSKTIIGIFWAYKILG